jgi:hypothetical protein
MVSMETEMQRMIEDVERYLKEDELNTKLLSREYNERLRDSVHAWQGELENAYNRGWVSDPKYYLTQEILADMDILLMAYRTEPMDPTIPMHEKDFTKKLRFFADKLAQEDVTEEDLFDYRP